MAGLMPPPPEAVAAPAAPEAARDVNAGAGIKRKADGDPLAEDGGADGDVHGGASQPQQHDAAPIPLPLTPVVVHGSSGPEEPTDATLTSKNEEPK